MTVVGCYFFSLPTPLFLPAFWEGRFMNYLGYIFLFSIYLFGYLPCKKDKLPVAFWMSGKNTHGCVLYQEMD